MAGTNKTTSLQDSYDLFWWMIPQFCRFFGFASQDKSWTHRRSGVPISESTSSWAFRHGMFFSIIVLCSFQVFDRPGSKTCKAKNLKLLLQTLPSWVDSLAAHEADILDSLNPSDVKQWGADVIGCVFGTCPSFGSLVPNLGVHESVLVEGLKMLEGFWTNSPSPIIPLLNGGSRCFHANKTHFFWKCMKGFETCTSCERCKEF